MSKLDEPPILVTEKGQHDPHIIIITDIISYILIIRVLNIGGGGLKESRFFLDLLYVTLRHYFFFLHVLLVTIYRSHYYLTPIT
jgi:hypothetical protein